MPKPPVKLSKIEEAINGTQLEWSLCFIGENQSEKLGALMDDLQMDFSGTGDGKQITSGFSYWGVGPSVAWIRACSDPTYIVMMEGTRSCLNLWRQMRTRLGNQKFHYVSLGVGTGQKDREILEDLHRVNPDLFYFPVDMSPEMLRIGIRDIHRRILRERRKLLAVQIDFSYYENIMELRGLLDKIVGGAPILYSLLGNTLANFENDITVLSTISKLIRPQDRLLLELAYTDESSELAAKKAAEEYTRSNGFKKFVTSALLQNTDLHVDMNSIEVIGEIEGDRAIRIKTLYRNRTGGAIELTLPTHIKVPFPEDDTIRLYLSRKYTSTGVRDLLNKCGYSAEARERVTFHPNWRNPYTFGLELLLLSPLPQESARSVESKVIPTAFISYSWDDEEHKTWVKDFASRLRSDGIDVTLDQWHTAPGDQLPAFMESSVRENDYILIICTPAYREKSDERFGGAGYEGDVITAEVYLRRNHRKFIPILRKGDWHNDAPTWLEGKYYVDLRGDQYSESRYRDLLKTLHNRRDKAPPIGDRTEV